MINLEGKIIMFNFFGFDSRYSPRNRMIEHLNALLVRLALVFCLLVNTAYAAAILEGSACCEIAGTCQSWGLASNLTKKICEDSGGDYWHPNYECNDALTECIKSDDDDDVKCVTTSGNDCTISVKDGPTLSEWGLIIFTLLLLTGGVLFIMRQPATMSAMGGSLRSEGGNPLPFVPAVFIKALTITGLLVLLGFAVAFWLSSPPSATDIVGTSISAPIFAYLLHLVMLLKR
jgi:hypothetical protein